jgi:subtilisin family serine protease
MNKYEINLQILMKTIKFLTIVALVAFSYNKTIVAQEFFYSFEGQKVDLSLVEDRFVIQLSPNISDEQAFQVLERNIGPIQRRSIHGIKSSGFYEIHLNEIQTNSNLLSRSISSLQSDGSLKNVAPVYLLHDQIVLTYDVFMVKMTNESVLKDLLELNEFHNIELLGRNPLIPEIVRLRLAPASSYNSTEMARLYYETLTLEWATPDFIPQIKPTGDMDDPYFDYQFYLQQIQVEDAWKITRGIEDIIVAVLDEGVMAHEDLPDSRIEDGYDAFSETDGAPGGNQAHGMAVAGIIAATHNNLGVAGIAPNVRIVPVRIFDSHGSSSSVSELEDAFIWSYSYGNGHADIINNSWAFGPVPPSSYPSLTEVIEYAATWHPVVFASGNYAGGPLLYPANIDEVIAVGAVDDDDVVYSWSGGSTSVGGLLDLVAPSGEPSIANGSTFCSSMFENRWEYIQIGTVWTLDIPGDAGYNPGDEDISSPTCYTEFTWSTHSGQPTPNVGYTSHFGGTSAAAPQVTGTVALIMSINPFIETSDYFDILHESADKVAGMDSNNHTNRYGYGRLNVYNALKYTIEHYGAILGREQPIVVLPLWENIDFHEDVYLASGSSMTIEANNTVTLSAASGNVTIGIPWGYSKSTNNGFNNSVSNQPILNPRPVTDSITLLPNYPNPFNPTTQIRWEMPNAGYARITVHDILGRELAVLADGLHSSGTHSALFDGSGLASGMYLYRLETPSGVVTRKMTLIK